MTFLLTSEAPPLRVDQSGAVRVGKTRVLFVLVIRAFQKGATPEEIVRIYETLDLADTYSAVAYYLRHRDEVEQYLEEYDQQAEEIRLKIEEQQGSQVGMRDRLLRRLAEKRVSEVFQGQKDLTHIDPTPKP
jgi:uncharacterized protein (DUF433 family)